MAWQEFVKGKRGKRDVQEFSRNLFDNILQLQSELANKTYKHGDYFAFNISDPKPRHIHKARVRDRLVHHAVYRVLYPFFDRKFIADSFSCRLNRGTHKALNRFRTMFYKMSRNNTRTCWVLKLDIKKFFASIDQARLLIILKNYILDTDILWLLEEIIGSFNLSVPSGHLPSPGENNNGDDKGLPLGNLTSQLFCNIYMNELDQFVKHDLKAKYYIRYADDFVLLSGKKEWLIERVPEIAQFLKERLCLALHPDKVRIKTFASGVDFLGWVHFPYHRVLRSATKRRVMRRIGVHLTKETLQSYLGLLKHGNAFKLQEQAYKEYLKVYDTGKMG